jgi:hypothetical protein
MHASALALPSAPCLVSVSRQRKATTNYPRAFGLLLAWLVLLLVALCSEIAVVYAVGSTVRMVFVDSFAQNYDAARIDH